MNQPASNAVILDDFPNIFFFTQQIHQNVSISTKSSPQQILQFIVALLQIDIGNMILKDIPLYFANKHP